MPPLHSLRRSLVLVRGACSALGVGVGLLALARVVLWFWSGGRAVQGARRRPFAPAPRYSCHAPLAADQLLEPPDGRRPQPLGLGEPVMVLAGQPHGVVEALVGVLAQVLRPLQHLQGGIGRPLVGPALPQVGRSRPATQRKMVVLPDPLGPNREKNDPLATLKLASRTALTSPSEVTNVFDKPTTSSMSLNPHSENGSHYPKPSIRHDACGQLNLRFCRLDIETKTPPVASPLIVSFPSRGSHLAEME